MISITNLSHRFGDREVLRGVNLEAESGEILAIMGSSGGGKTTLLRCVSGLVSATEGQIVVDGLDVRAEPERARRKMGLVFQSSALFDYLNVHENVAFGLRRWSRKSRREQDRFVEELLDVVGLEGEGSLMPDALSGGMKKRVALARAFMNRPKILFCDEPTGNLDDDTAAAMVELIFGLNRERSTTLVMVTHNLELARRCERILRLKGGAVISDETRLAHETH